MGHAGFKGLEVSGFWDYQKGYIKGPQFPKLGLMIVI